MLTNILKYNLREGEDLQSALRRYGVFGRDDYCWYIWLDYRIRDGSFYISIGDNTIWNKPDDRFEQLYQRLFGNIFENYSKK